MIPELKPDEGLYDACYNEKMERVWYKMCYILGMGWQRVILGVQDVSKYKNEDTLIVSNPDAAYKVFMYPIKEGYGSIVVVAGKFIIDGKKVSAELTTVDMGNPNPDIELLTKEVKYWPKEKAEQILEHCIKIYPIEKYGIAPAKKISTEIVHEILLAVSHNHMEWLELRAGGQETQLYWREVLAWFGNGFENLKQ